MNNTVFFTKSTIRFEDHTGLSVFQCSLTCASQCYLAGCAEWIAVLIVPAALVLLTTSLFRTSYEVAFPDQPCTELMRASQPQYVVTTQASIRERMRLQWLLHFGVLHNLYPRVVHVGQLPIAESNGLQGQSHDVVLSGIPLIVRAASALILTAQLTANRIKSSVHWHIMTNYSTVQTLKNSTSMDTSGH